MTGRKKLKRLVRLLAIEEHERQMRLSAAAWELARMKNVEHLLVKQEAESRQMVHASAMTGQMAARQAGMESERLAKTQTAALTPRIAEAQERLGMLRQEFLSKRIERRQMENLIARDETQARIEEERRIQQRSDEWFLQRKRSS